jgi:hypothetical protein
MPLGVAVRRRFTLAMVGVIGWHGSDRGGLSRSARASRFA